MKTSKTIQLLLLLLFLASSNLVSGDDTTYYTSFKDNNGERCIGIHVGDKLIYESYQGGHTLYENGTLHNYLWVPYLTLIEITYLADKTSTDDNFGFNRTEQYPTNLKATPAAGYLDSLAGSYFAYLDWNAFENMYNNRTQEDIDRQSRLGRNSYTYYGLGMDPTEQSPETFSLTYLSLSGEIFGSGSWSYDKTDGSLISSYRITNYNYASEDEFGRISSSHWNDVHLISKEKVSEDINCFDPTTSESSEKDDSPVYNYAYLLIFIPIIKSKLGNRYRPDLSK
ncbi:MAG: hypothetical protein ACXAC2_19970 [Candidatus Kariarchaeaceae archaeon]|jgi:hypothetical protein